MKNRTTKTGPFLSMISRSLLHQKTAQDSKRNPVQPFCLLYWRAEKEFNGKVHHLFRPYIVVHKIVFIAPENCTGNLSSFIILFSF